MIMGNVVLALWLILYGLANLVPIPGANIILAVVALVAGILLLVGR